MIFDFCKRRCTVYRWQEVFRCIAHVRYGDLDIRIIE